MSGPQIGLYLCQCWGEIGRWVDMEGLAKTMGKKKGVSVCRVHEAWCSRDGLEVISQDIREGKVDRVVLAGCSPREKEGIFRQAIEAAGLNPYLLERCNLREQCAWPHRDDVKTAYLKAVNLINMALARSRRGEPLTPLDFAARKTVLVVGAGIAGLSAALDLAAAGVEVMVAEKEAFIGGKVAKFYRYFPRQCPPSCGLEYLTAEIKKTPLITIYTLTEVSDIAGGPGNFQVQLRQRPRYVDIGACTACGKCAEVCPAEGSWNGPLPAAGKAISLPGGFAYPLAYVLDKEACRGADCNLCAAACPAGAINLNAVEQEFSWEAGAIIWSTGWRPYDARLLDIFGYGRWANVITNLEFERLAAPDGPTKGKLLRPSDGRPVKRVAFIQCAGSRDINHLPYCSQVCCAVTLKQVQYVRELAPEAESYVFYMDLRATGEYEAMYRRVQEEGMATFIRGNPAAVEEEPSSGRLTILAEDTLAGEAVRLEDLDLVVLAVGMQPEAGPERFIENIAGWEFPSGHVQCFPFETQRRGIYVAGCAHSPMDVSAAVRSAAGAAMKAMTVIGGDFTVAPTVPVVDKNKCDKCKRCMEECPFDAWGWDETEYPAPDLRKCRQCGICEGGCPLGVISLRNFTIKQLTAMVEAIDMGFLGREEPVVVAFLCANDAYPAADQAGRKGRRYPPNILAIPVPCAGAVNMKVVVEALTAGADGVLVGGCPSDQCHYRQGSDLAATRLANVGETLQRMAIEPERVRLVRLKADDDSLFVTEAERFVAELRALGPSPLKP
ncbi:FAD-dependent oxidoreductase [Moorella naiadis]|uniref:FAD-dependent oxidoreductase n=1 Tax=Moorella naiadis (nom. illeg.) TaxID=3093670 RepID=UPI003D9C8EC3